MIKINTFAGIYISKPAVDMSKNRRKQEKEKKYFYNKQSIEALGAWLPADAAV